MKNGDQYFLGKSRLVTPFFKTSYSGKLIRQQFAARGLTLLELLIVVALLSIVALATTSLIVDTGEWKRQQATEDQWLNIKRSIIGDNVVDANYRREYSGFVTDMGRLPNCMRELVRPYDCAPDLDGSDASATDATLLTSFAQDIGSNQWHGWRGPYLGVPGANEYRDGWANQGSADNTGNDDDVNYGWLFGTGAANGTACQDAVVVQQQPGSIVLQSCGDDEEVDNTETGFPADYPYTEFDASSNPVYVPLITRHDYQVELGESWSDAPVNFRSIRVAQSKIIPAESLRLRINYPVTDGRIPDWSDPLLTLEADRDVAPFLSIKFPATERRLVDATGKVYTGMDGDSDLFTDVAAAAQTVTVPSGTAISGTLMTVPNAISSTLVFSDASELELMNCPCELEVDAGSMPTSSTLTGAETITIKPENIAPIEADITKYVLEVPQGADATGSPISLPAGVTLTFNTVEDSRYFPKIIWPATASATIPTVTVSESFDIEGDLVETDVSGDQFLVPSTSTAAGNVITLEKAVPAIPQGLRNITIVCESDGLLFDGNCADNTGASPVYTPIATPYQLEVSPRAYIPVPGAILWNIE